MSTRARIGIQLPGDSVLSIYVHNDGYYSHHAPILLGHYNTVSEVMKLMQLGDLSSLGPTPIKCVAYGRDRGDTNFEALTSSSEPEFRESFEEYNYLFRDGKWWTSDSETGLWTDLALAAITERFST